ncbi:MAG: GNAT family N-acetyltransferase [Acidobacteriota bacterium]
MKVLETERLILRQMSLSDTENLLQIFSDPEAMRYYPGTKTTKETEEWIDWNTTSYRENDFGLWAAILKSSGEFAGQCGLVAQEVEGRREIEIGFLFIRKFWGRGLATEAARASRDYGINPLGSRRLISLIDPENIASRRVAEKVGMKLEKELEQWGKVVCLYSLDVATVNASITAGV